MYTQNLRIVYSVPNWHIIWKAVQPFEIRRDPFKNTNRANLSARCIFGYFLYFYIFATSVLSYIHVLIKYFMHNVYCSSVIKFYIHTHSPVFVYFLFSGRPSHERHNAFLSTYNKKGVISANDILQQRSKARYFECTRL